MSFKDTVRREILDVLPSEICCEKAFLSAVARTRGSIELSRGRLNLAISLEDADRALAIVGLIKDLYPTDVEIIPDRKKGGATVRMASGFSKQALIELELMRGDESGLEGFIEGVPQDLLRKECCRLAYFKGLMLTSGSVYVPDGGRSGYHFELQFDDEVLADDVMELLSDMRINTRASDRGEKRLLYVKDKDEILDILIKLGLNDSALTLKGIIDDRESANDFNRSIICETANYDKTVTASAKQILAIARLKSADGAFDALSPALKQTADARVQYPEATLSELAQILGVSKSCLNHRLRKLVELAHECEDDD